MEGIRVLAANREDTLENIEISNDSAIEDVFRRYLIQLGENFKNYNENTLAYLRDSLFPQKFIETLPKGIEYRVASTHSKRKMMISLRCLDPKLPKFMPVDIDVVGYREEGKHGWIEVQDDKLKWYQSAELEELPHTFEEVRKRVAEIVVKRLTEPTKTPTPLESGAF